MNRFRLVLWLERNPAFRRWLILEAGLEDETARNVCVYAGHHCHHGISVNAYYVSVGLDWLLKHKPEARAFVVELALRQQQ